MPEPDSNDKLTLTLDALRSDVERNPLADSLTVRRRGDQRTRRQAVGGALALVALVAGATGLYGGLGGVDRADAPIATGGATTPAPRLTAEIAAKPFVPTNFLTGLGDYDRIGPFLDSSESVTVEPQACDIDPAGWGAAELVSRRFYQDGSEATINEYVLRFDDAGQATAALLRPAADLAACPPVAPADGTVEARNRSNAPVEGSQATSRLFTPTAASEPSYQEVVAAFVPGTENVIVVLSWHAFGSGRAAVGWTFTDFQVQAALDRAVG